MADFILSFLIEKLGNSIWEEISYLYGAEEEKERCLKKLVWIQCFLKEADPDLYEDEKLCRFISEAREIASDIEDLLLANLPTVHLLYRHDLCKEMDIAFRRLDDLSESFKEYDMEQRRRKEDRFKAERERRETLGHTIDSYIVGFENNINNLLTLLTQGDRHVVSISGIGGSGKTTLARAVYNHGEVRRRFKHFGWVYISRRNQEKKIVLRKLLIDLLSPAATDREEIFQLEASEIASRLYKILESEACLLVFDDIWTVESFNSLFTNVFPKKNPHNSKILLTTRNKKVASGSAFLHEIQSLDDEKSWELLEKKAGLRDDSTNLEDRKRKEVLGRTMVKHCAGLPLAITLLGGILYNKSTVREWDDLQTEAKRLINSKHDGSVSWVLSLSYYELPQYLKPCFLFLAHFPEKVKIRVKELCLLWIAEGFITEEVSGSSCSLEYTANNYIDQLVSRYMVQIHELGSVGGSLKAIRVHDLVRDFCLFRANEENFVQLVELQNSPRVRKRPRYPTSLRSQQELSSNKVRRVALNVKYNIADELNLVIESRDPWLRSFVCFSTVDDPFYEAQLLGRLFCRFPLLRILKLENQESLSNVNLPEQIELLTQLRLLSLQGSHIQELPSAIRKLKLLQSLDLRSKWSVTLPDMDWDFEHLRHLYLPQQSRYKSSLLRLRNLESLQTLVNVSTMCWQLSELNHLTNLKKLTVCVDKNNRDAPSSCNNIDGLRSFTLKSKEEFHSVEVTSIRRILSTVYKLDLGVSIASLPQVGDLYGNLAKLTLRGTLLDSVGLSTLGEVKSLEILRLYGKALIGDEMKCSSGHFTRLQSLSLVKFQELRKWTVEGDAFQNLRHLHIERCDNLEAVPDGLRNINNLKKIVFQSMPWKFELRIREGGHDFHKVEHVPSRIIFKKPVGSR